MRVQGLSPNGPLGAAMSIGGETTDRGSVNGSPRQRTFESRISGFGRIADAERSAQLRRLVAFSPQ